uniref:Enoyl reductase (ER) domain-containing protein n=1 Tax=Globisporangium ultimum (strain ATCC 200006 / CBS 805.95 / DAOM BR144) TaxID=431595 RepID=K3WW91_GLOUD
MASLLSCKRVVVHTLSTDVRKATHIVEVGSTPKVHPGTTVVKNYYVGINTTDINITNGAYTSEPPLSVVIQVGEGVTGVNFNDVVAYRKLGAFAEYVEVEATALVKVLEPTPAVLPLIQLAKLAGNHMTGTYSTDEKVAYLQSLGCDRVITYIKEDVASVLKREYPNGLNLVFESVGGDLLRVAVDNIALHGHIISFGCISAYYKGDPATSSSGGNKENECLVSELVPKLLFRPVSLQSFMSGHFREHYLRHMDTLIDLVNTNKLVAGVDPAKFKGLEQIPDAINYMYAHKNVGKIVIQLG